MLLLERSWFWQVQLYAAASAVFEHTQHLPFSKWMTLVDNNNNIDLLFVQHYQQENTTWRGIKLQVSQHARYRHNRQ
jgi:hypothetical protein